MGAGRVGFKKGRPSLAAKLLRSEISADLSSYSSDLMQGFETA